MRTEANLAGGLGGVKLKFVGLEWSADSPILGKVTISQTDVAVTPLSLIEVVKESPPTLRKT